MDQVPLDKLIKTKIFSATATLQINGLNADSKTSIANKDSKRTVKNDVTTLNVIQSTFKYHKNNTK